MRLSSISLTALALSNVLGFSNVASATVASKRSLDSTVDFSWVAQPTDGADTALTSTPLQEKPAYVTPTAGSAEDDFMMEELDDGASVSSGLSTLDQRFVSADDPQEKLDDLCRDTSTAEMAEWCESRQLLLDVVKLSESY